MPTNTQDLRDDVDAGKLTLADMEAIAKARLVYEESMEAEIERENANIAASNRRVGRPGRPVAGYGRRTIGVRVHQKIASRPVQRFSKTPQGEAEYSLRTVEQAAPDPIVDYRIKARKIKA